MKKTQKNMSKNIDDLENCPKCNALWKTKDMYEFFLEKHGGVAEAARKSADFYGWSETDKKFFSRVLGVYDNEMDMTVAWECPDCKTRWSRFTNKQI